MGSVRPPHKRTFSLQRRSAEGGTAAAATTATSKPSLSSVSRFFFLLFLALLVQLLSWQKKVLSASVVTADIPAAVDVGETTLATTSLAKDMHGLSAPLQREDIATAKGATSDDATRGYPCFPSRQNNNLQYVRHNQAVTVVYLDTLYVNLHYETFYSFIHQICSCTNEKDSPWRIDTQTTPHFYVGPGEMLTVGFERVLREYNTTTCGPIFFGTPPRDPHLTIVTTSYPTDFEPGGPTGNFYDRLDDPRYIFICHKDAGPRSFLENATNVFFLTPLHRRYIVPSFFPPSLVRRHSKSLRQRRLSTSEVTPPPLFLVLGDFNKIYRRNVLSLVNPLIKHRDKHFTVRFLGGASGSVSNEILLRNLRRKFLPQDHNKLEMLPRTDTDEFFRRVGEADVILPLVDGVNFYTENGYQSGKKLTSSVMWGLGLGKKMILYRPLAEVFDIRENNHTYFLHSDSTATLQAYTEVFGRCLNHLLEHPT